jgi:hypothetical protein
LINVLNEKKITPEELIKEIEEEPLKQELMYNEIFKEGRRPYKKTMEKICDTLKLNIEYFETKLSKNLKKLILEKELDIKTGINNIHRYTGISKATMRAYIDSEREPTLKGIERLAEYFCVSIDSMLSDVEEDLKKLTDSERDEAIELIKKISILNSNQKNYIRESLKFI